MTHLDIEGLSALVDGEATPEEEAHAAGCPICQAGAERLRRVAAVVGEPVVPQAREQIDAAVAAALDAAPSPPPARRAVPAWLAPVLAVAAALALIGGVVALARGSHSSSASGGMSGAAASGSATTSAAAAVPSAHGASAAGLGPVAGPDQLAAAARKFLAGHGPPAALPASACTSSIAGAAAGLAGPALAAGAVGDLAPLTWQAGAAEAYLVAPTAGSVGSSVVVAVAPGCRVLSAARL